MNPNEMTNKMNGKNAVKDFSEAGKSGTRDLREFGSHLSERISDATEDATTSLKKQMRDLQKQGSEYTEAATKYVKENPMKMALAAAAVGLVTGFFMARRR